MQKLVECVPNFSEGRDAARVEAIVAAMKDGTGVWILDREMDPDHNRSVVTLAGEPEAVAEAVLRGVGRAAELIDLREHQGAHPRLGATDVVPFVPVQGITLEECVALAHRVGREIWERYRIPVYFYEAAALRADRVNLEDVRRGQFEGLREEVLRNPERAPDVGGPALHPSAGATIVGARKFLIAYNINLGTSDLSVARNIARAVRFSSGGLRFVKAMGVELTTRGIVQVSMNLTDFEQTPIYRVFELVRREAERYGVAVVGSEIVGLVPGRALEMAADFYLRLEHFQPEQIFERRLAAALAGAPSASGGWAETLGPFLEALGSPTPTPGGGSAAALAGAMAARLGCKVILLTLRKKPPRQVQQQLEEHLTELSRAAAMLTEAVARDAAAFEAVLAARRQPSRDASAREQAVQEATQNAVRVPLEVAERTLEVLARLRELRPLIPPAYGSDLRSGEALAAAGLRAALENVAINLEGLPEGDFVNPVRARMAAIEEQFRRFSDVAAPNRSRSVGPEGTE
jgi:glutamate formiminotransferase/formiminotetrahydrofolate cyclodeaminase